MPSTDAATAGDFALTKPGALYELPRDPGGSGEERARILIRIFLVEARTANQARRLRRTTSWTSLPAGAEGRPLVLFTPGS